MKRTQKKIIRKNFGHVPVVIQEDEAGGYWASCPVFQGCYSQGETLDEALRNIREAILLCQEEESAHVHAHAGRNISLHFVDL